MAQPTLRMKVEEYFETNSRAHYNGGFEIHQNDEGWFIVQEGDDYNIGVSDLFNTRDELLIAWIGGDLEWETV